MSLKDTAKKFGKVVLIALAGAVATIGFVLYGTAFDIKSISAGDVSAVSQQVEDAATAP